MKEITCTENVSSAYYYLVAFFYGIALNGNIWDAWLMRYEVLLQAENDIIVISPPGDAACNFSWRILKKWLWLPDSEYGNFLSAMYVSEITRFIANRIWGHRQSSARRRCTHVFMMDSEGATILPNSVL